MSLSNETSLSDHDVFEINRLVREVLAPIQEFIRQATAAVIPPDTFLLVPTHVERLSNLISSFNSLSNLLPSAYFEYAKWEMLECHDKLLEIEGFGSASGQLPSLFGDLGWEIGPRGYPRLALPRSIIETLIAEGDFSNVEIASLLGESCSLRTLKRRLQEWGIKRRQQNVSDDELANRIYEIKKTIGVFYGERAMIGILQSLGVWAPREKIRNLLRRIDPLGVSERWAQAITRRKYNVPFVNSLWHIDALLRLIRYLLVVQGGIDGRSHVVTFLACSNNNRAQTVAELFLKATQTWGWPSRVRADRGGENLRVKELMEAARGSGRGSFFAGPSVHNQRIERLWRDVFAWSIRPFYSLFRGMEDLGILNVEIPLHIWALHLVFLPQINTALQSFAETWNNHKLSACSNKTPRQLFVRGQIDAARRGFFLNPGPGRVLDDDQPEVTQHIGTDFTLNGSDFTITQRDHSEDDPHVQCEVEGVQGLTETDTSAIMSVANGEISGDEDFYGTHKYQRVVSLASALLLQRYSE